MRFLDSWTQLPPADLVRWLFPVGCMAVLVGFPGRIPARLGAIGVAAAVLVMPDVLPLTPLRFAWAGLWILIAWGVLGARRTGGNALLARRLGLLETGTVGLMLGLALVSLLVVAIARQDLPDDETRRASYGILVLCLGLLHLMLRRHTVRAAIALAMLGFGLQVIERVASESLISGSGDSPYAIVLATALACALAVRVGHTRERVATSPWVGNAHDLHD